CRSCMRLVKKRGTAPFHAALPGRGRTPFLRPRSIFDRVHSPYTAPLMTSIRAAIVAGAVLAATAFMPAQEQAAAQRGSSLFRERCAECHGGDGKSVAGHDLTRLFTTGATEDRVFQTIRAGVPNTLMPSSTAPDDEI